MPILFLAYVLGLWPQGMWDLAPGTRIEPTLSILEGKVLITGLPGRSLYLYLDLLNLQHFINMFLGYKGVSIVIFNSFIVC